MSDIFIFLTLVPDCLTCENLHLSASRGPVGGEDKVPIGPGGKLRPVSRQVSKCPLLLSKDITCPNDCFYP